MTIPKKRNIKINPTHAAGVLRKFGSGGAVDAAETRDAITGEHRHIINMVRNRCIAKGYRR